MSEQPTRPDANDPDADHEAPPASSGGDRHLDQHRFVEEVGASAAQIGGLLGRAARRARAAGEQLAHDARPEIERMAERARPEAERLALKAKAAAEAAKPHLQRAGREAAQYVKDHDTELKQAAATGATIASRRIIPPTYRPVIDALGIGHARAPFRQPAPTTASTEAQADTRKQDDPASEG